MGLKSFIQGLFLKQIISSKELTTKVLRSAPEADIRVEMVSRSGSSRSGKTISSNVKKAATYFVPKTIKDWNDAIQLATDPEGPKLQFLSELYDNLLLDAHVNSVIESRILRVLRSKYDLINANGDSEPELKKLLEKPWFETFVYETVMSKFTGIKVLELFDTDENGELLCVKSLPMAHILPDKQMIAKEPGDESGTSYIKGAIANYYIELSNNGELGMLSRVATYILAKKQAMGAWLDHLDKFGVPPLIINTDNLSPERTDELLEMGINMRNNHVMVTQGNEQFTIGAVPQTDSYRLFMEFLNLLNSEISKFFLGQDGTTQNKENAGTYGSLKVMQDVADDRHESDKLFVKYIINKELLPRLPKISSFYTPLTNYEFDWDESDELEQKEYVDSAVALTQAGYELDIEELSNRSGISISGYKNPNNFFSKEEEPKKKS